MKIRRYFFLVLALTLVISLMFTINVSTDASRSTALKDFEAVMQDKIKLNSFSNEDDLVNFITIEGEKANLSQDKITNAIKDYYKSRAPKVRLAKKDDSVKKELDQIRNRDIQRRMKFEEKIQEYVEFDTNKNYEKNIKFLLDNENIDFDKEEIACYIYSHHETIKDSNTKRRADEYIGLSPEKETR